MAETLDGIVIGGTEYNIGGSGGIPEAPTDGKTYGRKDGAWNEDAVADDFSEIENQEWLDVTIDTDERIVEGIKSDGTKYIGKIESPTLDEMNERIGQGGSGYSITRVATWGDSITDASGYQPGIADSLGISSSNVVDYGIASDFSGHVRRGFLSYYQDETPYAGDDGSHYDSSASLADRQAELKNSFILLFIGTNNVLNMSRTRSSGYTTGNEHYKAVVKSIYPEATDDNWQTFVDINFDTKMYAAAYKDTMLNDISDMVSIIPHNNWAIITGHGIVKPTDDRLAEMEEVDDIVTKMYPNNVINLKQLFAENYD